MHAKVKMYVSGSENVGGGCKSMLPLAFPCVVLRYKLACFAFSVSQCMFFAGPPRLESLVPNPEMLAKFEAERDNYKVRQVD